MYQFFSSKATRDLNKAYLKLFKKPNSLNKKFSNTLTAAPELQDLFIGGFKGTDMLTMDFPQLVEVYYKYINILNGLTSNRRKTINDSFEKVFNYNSYRGKIRNFLADNFDIHNCVYCDLESVGGYVRNNGQRNAKFHADHVLDKGSCPLVALSLHNFVPSCSICNEPPLKGVRPLGNTKEETLKISPKSRSNNFINEVSFLLLVTDEAVDDLDLFKLNQNWRIGFELKDKIYSQTIQMFDLETRYNNERAYFGKYLQKMKNNPPSRIRERALAEGRTENEIKEELFDFEAHRISHEPKEKCRRELMATFLPNS